MKNSVPPPRANIAVCLVAEDIFGETGALTLGECGHLLAEYNFTSVIHALVMLKHANEVVFGEEPISTDRQMQHLSAALKMLLTDADVRQIWPLCCDLAVHTHFIPFSNKAILAIMELAGMRCNHRDGRRLRGPGTSSDLGRVLFSLQSATLSVSFRTRVQECRDLDAIGDADLAQLVRNNLAHNAALNFGSCIGRFFAYINEPSIQAHFLRRAGRTVDDWFRSIVGMSMEDYVRAAFLTGSVACRFQETRPSSKDFVVFPSQFLAAVAERDRNNVQRLLELASQDSTDIGSQRSPCTEISDFVYSSFSVTIRPFIRLQSYWLPLSRNLVMEKFLMSIPHLLDESIRAAGGSNIEGTRGPFGYLLERYLGILFEGWFGGREGLRVIPNYTYEDCGREAEGDLLLIAGTYAFVFEVKAKVSTLSLRAEGLFEPISRMLREPALQAMRVSAAVARGDAKFPDGTAITGLTRVYPCAVIYDRIPLRPPVSERYERHLERDTGRHIFCENGTLMPLQFFDLETIEAWENKLDLSRGSSEIVTYLDSRSNHAWLRHGREFPASSGVRPRAINEPHQRFIDGSKVFIDAITASIAVS